MIPGSDGVVAPSLDQTPEGWSDRADAYDAWLAPLTRRFAADVVLGLGLAPGIRFLDVATGTGALALAAARAGADVLATDFAPGMVSATRGNLATEGLRGRVEVMDGQALALPDHAFDAVGSLLGLIFFPDMAAGARELRRVLRIGGQAAVVTWAPEGFTVQRLALEALAAVIPDETDRPTLPPAFRLTDPAVLEMLLRDAGFATVEIRELEHAWPIPEPEGLFHAVPSWSTPLRVVFERLELDLERLEEAAAVFARLVRERSTEEGLPMRMLLAIGTR